MQVADCPELDRRRTAGVCELPTASKLLLKTAGGARASTAPSYSARRSTIAKEVGIERYTGAGSSLPANLHPDGGTTQDIYPCPVSVRSRAGLSSGEPHIGNMIPAVYGRRDNHEARHLAGRGGASDLGQPGTCAGAGAVPVA